MKVDYCEEDLILRVFPTVEACFQEGWIVLKNNFLLLLLIVIVSEFVKVPMGYEKVNWLADDSFEMNLSFFRIFALAYYLLVVVLFSYGSDWIFLKASRNQKPQFEEILSGFKKFLYVVLSHLLVIGIVGIGFVLLILPGVYLLCKLVFVPYLIMDKKIDPVKAVKLSFYLSKGYFWTILGMGILSFVVIILGFICLIVGVFASIIWIRSAFAVLYKAVEELHLEEACQLAEINMESINE